MNQGLDIPDASNPLESIKSRIFTGREELGIVFNCLELSALDLFTIDDLLYAGGLRNDQDLTAILMAMFSSLNEGSICLDLDENVFRKRFPGRLYKPVINFLNNFLFKLGENYYKELITEHPAEYLPLVFIESNGKRLLYFQKFFINEEILKSKVEAFIKEKFLVQSSSSKIDSIIDEIYSPHLSIRGSRAGSPMAKDSMQVSAIKLAMKHGFSIISGGPGTGKTSLMVNIVRALVRTGIHADEILLGAPTGRAAQRMTEAVRKDIASIESPAPEDLELLALSGSTIHKILKYRKTGNIFLFNAGNPLPASVVIIDEVSMVDLVMLSNLFQAIDPSRTEVILIGDKDQLPSVEAGAVFSEMVPSDLGPGILKTRITILKTVFRAGKILSDLANELNAGIVPKISPSSLQDAVLPDSPAWAFVESESAFRLKEDLIHWTDFHFKNRMPGFERTYKEMITAAAGTDHQSLSLPSTDKGILDSMFEIAERTKILCLTRGGTYGCNIINRIISACLVEKPALKHLHNPALFSGAVIMITRNDYTRELYNGDLGIAVKDMNSDLRVYFKRSGIYQSYLPDQLPPWEPAFAITVHKSQGSEYDKVLLVLPEDVEHRLLTREVLYTGLTRAREKAILYGSPKAFHTAIGRKIVRHSGINW